MVAAVISTISNTITNTVTLGTGTYNAIITIAATGAVVASSGEAILSSVKSTISNYGTIEGPAGAGEGILFQNYYVDAVYNAANAVIYGFNAGVAIPRTGIVLNQGTIIGANAGVSVTGNGTVLNQGTIIAGAPGGDAVIFSTPTLSRLIVDPGAVFIGSVVGASALEFAAGTVGSIGSLNLSSFSGFSAIGFDAGSEWSLEGPSAEFDAGQAITGFGFGDTIVLDGFAATSEAFYITTGLTVTDAANVSETLHIAGAIASNVSISSDGLNTTIVAGDEPLFQATGTVAYETIATSGSYILTAEGGMGGAYFDGTTYYYAGGDGGIVTGTFSLTAGTTLEIVVGSAGGNDPVENGVGGGGGGGGGSFIYDETTGTLLEAAGGGGGSTPTEIISGIGKAASATTSGGNGSGSGGSAGGTLGSGGTAGSATINGYDGGGGGGISSGGGKKLGTLNGGGGAGGSLPSATGPQTAVTLPQSGGTAGGVNAGAGGFGGGGGAGGSGSGGGGGGFSGGGGGGQASTNTGGGGGGGSFLATSATNAADLSATLSSANFSLNTDGGNGLVEITPVPPPLISIISTSVTSTVDPGNGIYATGITITNTGAITTSGNYSYGAPNGIYGASNVPGISINNSGTINSANNYGVYLKDGGAVTNSGTASYIYGGDGGVRIFGGSGTVMNQGTIFGRADYGIYLASGGTVINAGTISSNAYAVNLKSNAYNRLVIEQGAVFIGKVEAGGASDALEFAASTATGTLDLGNSFTGFNTISFDVGASWSIEGSIVEFDAGQTITGFTVGDTIILDGFVVDTLDTTYVTGIGLELTDTLGNQITLDFVEPAGAATGNFIAVDPPDDTTITYMACFTAGTRMLTADGRLVAVEQLAAGDAVEIYDGSASEIIWVGRRRIDVAVHPRPETVRPIRIEAGALGGGLPWRELVVSPDHGIYLDGHLIPAKILLNGETIRQLDVGDVTYYHIELARHAVLFAEGAAAESYLETGNRGAFENEAVMLLHPDFAQTKREAESCAPFVEAGPVVEAVRQRILDRANIQTTQAPELKIQIRDGDAHIISRAAIPGQLQADPRDQRRLGVKIAAIRIGGATLCLAHPMLSQGWHNVEPDGRWTDGHAVIPAALVTGEVTVELAGTMRYREGPALAA
jgi:hypothetical protein